MSAPEIMIIGAGMTGLTAAGILRDAGREVLVVDKGRGVGGRMASRRFGGAVFDHGAQFFTARDSQFVKGAEAWVRSGSAEIWYRSVPGSSGNHPRYRGVPSMTAVPKLLAAVLQVRLSRRATSVRRDGKGWAVEFDDGEILRCEALILTPPAPQTIALLEAGGVDIPGPAAKHLEDIEFDGCVAAMAILEGPSGIPEPGTRLPGSGAIAWIADNQVKGVSPIPAITIHSTTEIARTYFDETSEMDRQEIGENLIREATALLGVTALEFQIHGWRYARLRRTDSRRHLVISENPFLAAAGDAFAGPRVEGAALSGRSVAAAFLE